jgi:hypothetical protein
VTRIEDSFAQTPVAGILLGEAHLEEHGRHNQKSHGRSFTGIAGDTARWGGTSVNYVGHHPKTGYMVGGVVPSKVVPGGASRSEVRDAIKDFVKQHRETLRKPGFYLGTWRDDDDGGKVWIDISQRTSTLRAARTVGQERNEIAVFDVKRMESIDIGGTGNAEG